MAYTKVRSGLVDTVAKITCVGKVARVTGRVVDRSWKVARVCMAPEMGSKIRIPLLVTMKAVPSARKARPSGVSPVAKVCRVLSLRLIRVTMFLLGSEGTPQFPKCATRRYLESGDRERAPG